MSGGAGTVRAPGATAPAPGAAERGSGVGPAIKEWPLVSSLDLAPLEGAPACGRGHTRNVLRDWGLAELADDAELLVSELLTNALKASVRTGEPILLRLLGDSGQLLIEVYDHSPMDPATRPVSGESESGRGFMVVQALANSWGFHRFHRRLKVVWAELLVSPDWHRR